jgi:hypothetical protein
MTSSQIHLSGGTAAETPEMEADRAGAFREAARAVFREAATVAGTSLPDARGRRHHVHPTAVAVPQGFKNVQLANEAIEYVQNLSKVSSTRPSHMYSQIVRDGMGKVIKQDQDGKQTIRKPIADQHSRMLNEFRAGVLKVSRAHADDAQTKGANLTKHERFVMLLRRANAGLLENAKSMGADQLVANCSERAMMAFDLLANKNDNPQLDVVGLTQGEGVKAFAAFTGEPHHLARGPDHVFLLIGRNPESDIADSDTWGDDTVICDAWAKRTYAVSAFKEEMALLSSTTNGQTRCDPLISWPANTPYNSDPTVIYREKDGIGR